MPRILVIDDDRETCRFMGEILAAPERSIEAAQAPAEALELLRAGGFDAVISDIYLDAELTGLDLLREFRRADPSVEVILVSGFGTLETAVEAVRLGAFDYISKPFDVAEVRRCVERALRKRAAGGAAPAPLERHGQLPSPPDGLIGRSRGMLSVYKQIAQAASSDAGVLVTGETGTGKELVARAIHRHSARSGHPFVAVNCGALAEGLLESELFGHVRGAFTGAVADKKGLFEQAHRGTLFLDEVGEMSQALQVRVLRALQQGEVRPVGAARAFMADVRVVAATHRGLEQDVAAGTFRQDLYYRLNVLHIALPPLRERREDIALLANHFLRLVSERERRAFALTAEAVARLSSFGWPGNVRELENTLERAALAARGGVIDVDDIPLGRAGAAAAAPPAALFDGLPSLDELEKRYLQHVLEATGGNHSKAAEVLGIDRRTLYRMEERLGLKVRDGG